MKKHFSNHVNILDDSISSVLLKLSIPIIIGNIAQTLYGLVDVYWLGKLGASELAAITLANPIVQMLVNIGMGLSTATSILVSQSIGRGEKQYVNSILYHVLLLISLGAGSILLLVWLNLESILILLGSSGIVTNLAFQYLTYVFIGIELYFITNIYIALENANGNAKIAFYANTIGLLINLLISPILIMHFHLSVVGAGIASLISRSVPFFIFAPKLFNSSSSYNIRLLQPKFEVDRIKDIIKLAFPLSLGGATIQLGFMVMGRNVIQFGNGAMAAYGVGNRISSLVTIPSNSIGNALTIIVGQNFGAKQMDRVKAAYQKSLIFSVSYLILLGFLLAWFPITHWISNVFISDPSTLKLTIQYVQILAIYCFANGFYNSTMAVFNGLGYSSIAVIVDVCRIWLFRLIALNLYSIWFGKHIKVIWYSVVFSNGLAAVVIVILYLLLIERFLKTDTNGDNQI